MKTTSLIENTAPAVCDCTWCNARGGIDAHSPACPCGERYKQVQKLGGVPWPPRCSPRERYRMRTTKGFTVESVVEMETPIGRVLYGWYRVRDEYGRVVAYAPDKGKADNIARALGPLPQALDHNEAKAAVIAMHQYGGSFVQQLAVLWEHADQGNQAHIERTWPGQFAKYLAIARNPAAEATKTNP